MPYVVQHPQWDLGQLYMIRCIRISAVCSMHIHSKWDKSYKELNLSSD